MFICKWSSNVQLIHLFLGLSANDVIGLHLAYRGLCASCIIVCLKIEGVHHSKLGKL